MLAWHVSQTSAYPNAFATCLFCVAVLPLDYIETAQALHQTDAHSVRSEVRPALYTL
jgi:hypothetical protein